MHIQIVYCDLHVISQSSKYIVINFNIGYKYQSLDAPTSFEQRKLLAEIELSWIKRFSTVNTCIATLELDFHQFPIIP